MCQALKEMVDKEKAESFDDGEQSKMHEIAKTMYDSKRYDIEDIIFVTGMNEEEVKELCYS